MSKDADMIDCLVVGDGSEVKGGFLMNGRNMELFAGLGECQNREKNRRHRKGGMSAQRRW